MNVLKAIKNVRTRNLIVIYVDSILDINPTKIEVTSSLIQTNMKVFNNPMDIKLVHKDKAVFLKDVQQVKTSLHFTEAYSDNQLMRIPTYRICEIYLIKPLTIEEGNDLMLLLEQ